MAVSNVWKVVQSWLDQQRFPPNQSKLAEAVGVQRSAVSDWKSGKSRPNPEHLLALAKLMAPTLGPRTYTSLVMAVIADMGYADVGWEKRLPADFVVEPDDQHGYGVMRNILTAEQLAEVEDESDEDDVVVQMPKRQSGVAARDVGKPPRAKRKPPSDDDDLEPR